MKKLAKNRAYGQNLNLSHSGLRSLLLTRAQAAFSGTGHLSQKPGILAGLPTPSSQIVVLGDFFFFSRCLGFFWSVGFWSLFEVGELKELHFRKALSLLFLC